MAIRVPEELEISDVDQHLPCQFCGAPDVADPDDLTAWAGHLVSWHGFEVVEPRDEEGHPRKVRLRMVGWAPRAKFAVNQRVNVKMNSRPRETLGGRLKSRH